MTILVGYTNTHEGRAALRQAKDLADWKQTALIICILDEVASAQEDHVLAQAVADGARLVERDPRDRYPVGALLDAAVEQNATFITIGVKTRSRVGKILLGSNAQSIILGANVPVLTVKGEHDGD